LLDAIPIEDAILPNGIRGVQPNLLANGDVESPDCETNASMPSSWHVEQVSGNVSLSVASYLASPSVTYPAHVQILSGRCYYAARGRQGQVMMRQVVHPKVHRVSDREKILTFKLVCAPIETIEIGQALVQLRIEQFDEKEMSLLNYTRGEIVQKSNSFDVFSV
jgi:hypothetical protein